MTSLPTDLTRVIWATRGRSWGFRFLLNAGLGDPLPEYERAFGGLTDSPTAWTRTGNIVALRLPDPQGRRDSAGRVIPHEFVILGDLADSVNSVVDGLQRLWPLVEHAYEQVWDAESAPAVGELLFT